MKVRIQVVRWETGGAITIDDFCQYLAGQKCAGADCKLAQAISFAGWPRLIFANHHGDYWIILMLTLKAPKGAIEADDSAKDGTLTFVASSGAKSRKVVEFNYLLINKNTGIGVYSHYFGSTHFKKFTSFFRQQYYEMRKGLVDQAKKAGMSDEDAWEKYKGRFGSTALLTKERASQLIQQLREIDHLSLSFDTLESAGGILSPYKEVTRSSHHVIRFNRDSSLTKVRELIVDTITKVPGLRGSVHGTTKKGLGTLVRLQTNLGVVDEFDHDEAVNSWKFNPTKLADSTVLKRMKTVVEVNPAQFVTKTKSKSPLPEDDDLEDEE